MKSINDIVIVGGGTAGWLAAGMLASTYSGKSDESSPLTLTVIESDTVHPIGVGEGTWPTMRRTLSKIGITESMLVKHASATFKQASKFVNWHNSENGNSYYHPFSAPQGSATADISPYWLMAPNQSQYAHDVCFQPSLCELGLAPKANARSANGQTFSANYGYHLDAGKFIDLLRSHCVEKLGVKHIVDDVIGVRHSDVGIDSVSLQKNKEIAGDLFIDCSGFSALLIEKALGVEIEDASHQLFSDRALVCQIPYTDENSPIACHTLSTAQEAGWIWDIGLQKRRGTGYVYSSAYQSPDEARNTYIAYLQSIAPSQSFDKDFREIKFKTGYRKQFWKKNCVAIGLSSGFLEPLEASSLMLIEQSVTLLAEQLPANAKVMEHAATRFNTNLTHMWQRTIEFLKLHYVLSSNSTPFWQDNKDARSIPSRLNDLLEEWRFRPVLESDFPSTNDVFSAQSYRYILYGMGQMQNEQFDFSGYARSMDNGKYAEKQFDLNKKLINQLKAHLPSHRGLIEQF